MKLSQTAHVSPLRSCAAVALACVLAVPSLARAQDAVTDPVGVVTVNVTAGTGTVKRNTFISLPLLQAEEITGQAVGRITGVTANTISNANANWATGELSNPATPFIIKITSGSAEGRIFLIASSANTAGALQGTPNTATTITISPADAAQVDLTALGIQTGANGDTYTIYACDTLSSFFGTPSENGLLGGPNANNADTILLVVNGSVFTYHYSTSLNRWTRLTFGNPDASNVALVPNYGIQYQRLSASPLSFSITGSVPTKKRQVSVKNFGTTLLSQYWPIPTTLNALGLQNLSSWVSGPSTSVADLLTLTVGTSVNTYWHDGTNWRRLTFGNPISDNVEIRVGTSVNIQKKGSLPGFSTLLQSPPYGL